jgi:N-acetylglucosamine-6-phosphate deacetylase
MTVALAAPLLFDGESWLSGHAVTIDDGTILDVVREDRLSPDIEVQRLEGMLVPGFVDLQVNGGGGVLLNDAPEVETIRTICRAHAQFGTTALLPTLITDSREVTRRALEAGRAAATERVPGFLGLHLEGPHLSVERKGAHDAEFIRPLDDGDMRMLAQAARHLPALMMTVAPETVSPGQISALTAAGIAVSLGHSQASFGEAAAAVDAGARMVTHLFNAMSPLAHRDPGLVGAALERGELSAGLIADGIHVDPHAVAIALRAKNGPGRIFLVTDAMATIGTDMTEFTLNGRRITRSNGRLTLPDGTLAGADLDMISAVRFMHREIGLDLGEALRMASLYPARAIGHAERLGRLAPEAAASLVHLSDDLAVRNVWIDGRHVHGPGN